MPAEVSRPGVLGFRIKNIGGVVESKQRRLPYKANRGFAPLFCLRVHATSEKSSHLESCFRCLFRGLETAQVATSDSAWNSREHGNVRLMRRWPNGGPCIVCLPWLLSLSIPDSLPFRPRHARSKGVLAGDPCRVSLIQNIEKLSMCFDASVDAINVNRQTHATEEHSDCLSQVLYLALLPGTCVSRMPVVTLRVYTQNANGASGLRVPHIPLKTSPLPRPCQASDHLVFLWQPFVATIFLVTVFFGNHFDFGNHVMFGVQPGDQLSRVMERGRSFSRTADSARIPRRRR